MYKQVDVIKAKHYLVLIVFLLGMISYLLAIRAVYNVESNNLQEITKLNASTRTDAFKRDIVTATNSTNIIKYVVKSGYNLDDDHFEVLAKGVIDQNPSIDSLQLAPDGKVTTIYPLADNEAGLIDLLADKKRGPIAVYGRDNKLITIQGPFDLKQGGQGIAVRNPIYIKDATGKEHFWGFVIAIIEVPAVFQQTVDDLVSFGYDFRLYKTNPLQHDYQFVTGSAEKIDNPVMINFEAGGFDWRLEVMPQGGWNIVKKISAYIALGLLLVVLFTVLVYFIVLLDKDRKILRKLSRHDALTGLFNKRVFSKKIKNMDNEGKSGGIFYIDTNSFKQVNDNYGHSVGDDVLREIAHRLCHVTRYPVFRIGGDEFIILINDKLPIADYKVMAETIMKAFKQPVISGDLRLNITVSLGYAMVPMDAANMHDLYEIADRRMYEQKRQMHEEK